MKRRFCGYCGGILEEQEREDRQRLVCADCDRINYENPLPVASMLIANEQREVLLVRRRNEPHQGMWCLPIGFAELGESIEEAACRELCEEAGIEAEPVHLLDVSSHFERLYGELLIVTYEGRMTGGAVQAGDDAEDARFWPVATLPKLAFEPQHKAVQTWLRLHQDEWEIRSAMESFVLNAEPSLVEEAPPLPSDVLKRFVAIKPEPMVQAWLEEIKAHPSTPRYAALDAELLRGQAEGILRQFGRWLPRGLDSEPLQDLCTQIGRHRFARGVPLSELLSALSLLKKHVWLYHVQTGFWERPMDIYRTLELDKRVSFFFDYVTYHVARAYEAQQG